VLPSKRTENTLLNFYNKGNNKEGEMLTELEMLQTDKEFYVVHLSGALSVGNFLQ
jgi:hypothetical protein